MMLKQFTVPAILAVVGSCATPRDARRCAAPIAELALDQAAVRCAETFVARNGYTEAPPADSGDIAFETVEFTTSITELLVERRNTLNPRALYVCATGRRSGPGFTVLFGYRPTAITDRIGRILGVDPAKMARAVTMSLALDQLLMEHQSVDLSEVAANPKCKATTRLSNRGDR